MVFFHTLHFCWFCPEVDPVNCVRETGNGSLVACRVYSEFHRNILQTPVSRLLCAQTWCCYSLVSLTPQFLYCFQRCKDTPKETLCLQFCNMLYIFQQDQWSTGSEFTPPGTSRTYRRCSSVILHNPLFDDTCTDVWTYYLIMATMYLDRHGLAGKIEAFH